MYAKLTSRFALAVLYLVAVSGTAIAQTTARIVGTVRDVSGAAVLNANVEVRNLTTNAVRTATTTESGDYSVPSLPIGRYSVSATLPGFKRVVQPDVELTIDQTARVDLTLEPGQVTESVQVEASAPIVNS